MASFHSISSRFSAVVAGFLASTALVAAPSPALALTATAADGPENFVAFL